MHSKGDQSDVGQANIWQEIVENRKKKEINENPVVITDFYLKNLRNFEILCFGFMIEIIQNLENLGKSGQNAMKCWESALS